jgi:hypothetical protein
VLKIFTNVVFNLSLAKSGNVNGAGPNQPTKMIGNALYMGLKGLQLTEEQLVANGNPRIHPSGEPGWF